MSLNTGEFLQPHEGSVNDVSDTETESTERWGDLPKVTQQ